MSARSEALAARLEAGASALATFAATLSESQWQTRVPHDGRKIGVVVHHVASVYPIELHLGQELAAGRPITNVTWDAVHTMNRDHSKEHDGVTVWNPEGRLIGRIRLPEVCANVAFGGPKGNRLFMTASQSLYAVYLGIQGAGSA